MSSAAAPQMPVHSLSTVGPASTRQSLHVPMFGTFASPPGEPDDEPPDEDAAPLLDAPPLLELAPPSALGFVAADSSSPHAVIQAIADAEMMAAMRTVRANLIARSYTEVHLADRVRVLIVDDSAFARRVIWQALVASPDFEVIGTASDGLEALEAIVRLEPDVMTLDWNMPVCDGAEVLAALSGQTKKPKVVVVTANEASKESIVTLGAFDVVRKAGDTMSLDELVAALRRASAEAA